LVIDNQGREYTTKEAVEVACLQENQTRFRLVTPYFFKRQSFLQLAP